MPSKTPIKAAKKPGKAIPRKAVHKTAVAKKATRPPPSPKPLTSKVPVKPQKPAPKAPTAKPAAVQANHVAHPPRVKAPPTPELEEISVSSDKAAPIKFDSRPLVMPTRASVPSDDDADG